MRYVILLMLPSVADASTRWAETWEASGSVDWMLAKWLLVALSLWGAWAVARDARSDWRFRVAGCGAMIALAAACAVYPTVGVILYAALLMIAIVGVSL